jgi:hypothetical protein
MKVWILLPLSSAFGRSPAAFPALSNARQDAPKTFFKKSPTVLNTINGGDSNTYDSVVSNCSAVSLESDWLLSIKPAKAGRVLRLMPGLGGWESSQPTFLPGYEWD